MNKELRTRIKKKYGSQAEFSMRVPEDESVISRIIYGRRGLKPERKKVWARVLNCKVSDIFGD